MKKIKYFSQILLITIFLSSCKTSINKEFPKKDLEKNFNEKPNSEKKKIEIKFSKFVSEMFPEVLRPKSFDNFI